MALYKSIQNIKKEYLAAIKKAKKKDVPSEDKPFIDELDTILNAPSSSYTTSTEAESKQREKLAVFLYQCDRLTELTTPQFQEVLTKLKGLPEMQYYKETARSVEHRQEEFDRSMATTTLLMPGHRPIRKLDLLSSHLLLKIRNEFKLDPTSPFEFEEKIFLEMFDAKMKSFSDSITPPAKKSKSETKAIASSSAPILPSDKDMRDFLAIYDETIAKRPDSKFKTMFNKLTKVIGPEKLESRRKLMREEAKEAVAERAKENDIRQELREKRKQLLKHKSTLADRITRLSPEDKEKFDKRYGEIYREVVELLDEMKDLPAVRDKNVLDTIQTHFREMTHTLRKRFVHLSDPNAKSNLFKTMQMPLAGETISSLLGRQDHANLSAASYAALSLYRAAPPAHEVTLMQHLMQGETEKARALIRTKMTIHGKCIALLPVTETEPNGTKWEATSPLVFLACTGNPLWKEIYDQIPEKFRTEAQNQLRTCLTNSRYLQGHMQLLAALQNWKLITTTDIPKRERKTYERDSLNAIGDAQCFLSAEALGRITEGLNNSESFANPSRSIILSELEKDSLQSHRRLIAPHAVIFLYPDESQVHGFYEPLSREENEKLTTMLSLLENFIEHHRKEFQSVLPSPGPSSHPG